MTKAAGLAAETTTEVTHKDWYAWINTMNNPHDFHVVGEVQVANPGVKAELVERYPQGFNPQILILDLHFIQQPGMWIQPVVTVQTRFEKTLTAKTPKYTQVQVMHNDKQIALIDVETIQ